MSDRLAAFQDSFQSVGLDKENRKDLWALADYTLNTLRVFEPANKPGKMTIVHALSSREEFMHGDWNVGLIHSVARLRLAAIDALYEILADQDPDRWDELFPVIHDAWIAADRIDEAVKPFQEAVDKLQVLSVINDDDEFLRKIEETFEANYDHSEIDDIDIKTELEREIRMQSGIARGREVVDRESIYVNPLYYYALREAAKTGNDETSTGEGDQFPTDRAVAETVARVTLDIPFPIAPLNSEDEFAPLHVDGIDFESVSVKDLNTMYDKRLATRYSVSKQDIKDYILVHAEEVESESLRRRIGTTIEEYEKTWLDDVFVTTIKALENLAEEADVTAMNPEELRRRLGMKVHGVDLSEEATMLDYPTHLLEIPAEASSDIPQQDLLSVEGDPLPKVLLEAFEQHGSFGAAVFRPVEGENMRQLNPHAMEVEDLSEYPDVHESIESYQTLWERYFFGKEMMNTLFDRSDQYIDHLIEQFADSYESIERFKQEFEAELHAIHEEPQTHVTDILNLEAAAADPSQTSRPTSAQGLKSTKSELDDRQEVQDELAEQFENLDRRSGSDDRTSSNDATADAIQSYLSDRLLLELREAARRLDIEVDDIDEQEFDPLECPLCDVGPTPCGGEECITTTRREQFNTELNRMIERLAQEVYAATHV